MLTAQLLFKPIINSFCTLQVLAAIQIIFAAITTHNVTHVRSEQLLSETRLLQVLDHCVVSHGEHQVVKMFLQLTMSWDHQEATVAGCNMTTSIMAVVYTVMAAVILTGWLNRHPGTAERWYLALCSSSFWLGAVYIQSAMVSYGYVTQVSCFHNSCARPTDGCHQCSSSYVNMHLPYALVL